jgi:hypothetical protein
LMAHLGALCPTEVEERRVCDLVGQFKVLHPGGQLTLHAIVKNAREKCSAALSALLRQADSPIRAVFPPFEPRTTHPSPWPKLSPELISLEVLWDEIGALSDATGSRRP